MTAVALEAAPARTRATWLVPALVVLVATVVAWWASVPYLVGVFHDDGVYALLARSLATGQGFHYLQLPGQPAATHYPPGYPLALAAIWRLFPDFPANVPALLFLNALSIGVAALGLHQLLQRWFGWRSETAGVVALGALLGTPVLTLSGALMSEPLFLACLPPVLLLAQRALDETEDRVAVTAGVAIGALMLVRTHALALLGAVVLLMALRRAWRRATLLGVAAIVVQLPWVLWCRAASPVVSGPLNGTYGAYPAFFLEGWRTGGMALLTDTVRTNVHELWLLLGDRVWGGLGLLVGMTSALLLLGLIVAGTARGWKRAPVLVLFVAAYLAIVVVMSCTPYRYAWGVWPLLFAMAVVGAEAVIARAPGRALRIAACVVVAIPFLAIARTEARGYASREWERPARDASRPAVPVVEWVRRYTAPDAVVLAEPAEIVTLFTGRRAAPPEPFTAREYIVPLTATDHARGLAAMLGAVPARYLVTFNPGVQQAAHANATLRAVATYPGIEMYEVQR